MKIHFKVVKQTFLISATMKVSLNGNPCAWLGPGQEAIIDAPEGKNSIHLSGSIRSKSIEFEAKNDVVVTIRFSRFSGRIEALVTGQDVQILK